MSRAVWCDTKTAGHALNEHDAIVVTGSDGAFFYCVKGHRDFPVGGQLISLWADRLCPCSRSADLLAVRSAASLPFLRWPRRAGGWCPR
jgi:hypothetical protein